VVVNGVFCLHSAADVCIQSYRRTVDRVSDEAFFRYRLRLTLVVSLCSHRKVLGLLRGRIDRYHAGATIDEEFGPGWDIAGRVSYARDGRDRQGPREDGGVTGRAAALGHDRGQVRAIDLDQVEGKQFARN